jgi:NADH-quinone oxidoreductase subunit H
MIMLPLALLQTADPQLPPTSDGAFFLFTLIKMVVIFTVYMITVAMLTLAERRISAWIQDRQGPNRVGYGGLLQPAADGVKNFMKEETYPAEAYTPLFVLAPALTFIPALLTWAVIPFASPMPTRWGVIDLQLADIPVGFLFILAIGSLGVYGIVLAGWSSNNKYALLGGLRSSAQMISYEIAMGMSLIPVLLIAGNVTLTSIVRQQATMGWNVILLSVSFFVFLVAAFAETNRLPFDLPEAESELIAGYHTEYSGMKFSMFMIGEYANMLTASALISTIFFGGWDIPFTTWDNVAPFSKLKTILTLGAMITKVLFFCFFYIWIRWTLPRFRYDQLMSLGWKFMLPLALTYIVVVASATLAFDALGLQRGSYAYLGALGALNLVLLIALFVGLDRGRLISPAYGRTRRPQLAQLQAVYKRTGAMVPPLAPEPGD